MNMFEHVRGAEWGPLVNKFGGPRGGQDQAWDGPQVIKFEQVYSGHLGIPCQQTD